MAFLSLVAFVYASATVGPVLGFGCGAALMELYVDFISPSVVKLTLTPTDTQWVGAWWVGFLIFGILTVATAPPFFAFPKALHNPDVYYKDEANMERMKVVSIEGETLCEEEKFELAKSDDEMRWSNLKRE